MEISLSDTFFSFETSSKLFSSNSTPILYAPSQQMQNAFQIDASTSKILFSEPLHSSKTNSELSKDYVIKGLGDKTINPFSVINGLLFVPRDKFDLNFTITLTDKINNKNYQLSALNPKIEF